MPKIDWNELDVLIHDTKNDLMKLHKIELLCKNLKKDILTHLDKLHEVVLKQVNGDNKNNEPT